LTLARPGLIAAAALTVAWSAWSGTPGTQSAASAQSSTKTPDIHYVPTPPRVVDAMLDIADVRPGDVVYDLGSGDGRIPIAAAKRGARGVGIEIDGDLVRRARRNAKAAGVSSQVTFIEGDIFAADLSPATVVTLYLLGSLNQRLRPKLFRETAPGTRIVSHRFRMGDWEPERAVRVDRADLWLWRVPSR
jgi:SAM-dependent methyltransferase